jgi:hypothetical protein
MVKANFMTSISRKLIKQISSVVNTVLYFQLLKSSIRKNMLVYLNSDGLITDLDIVDD